MNRILLSFAALTFAAFTLSATAGEPEKYTLRYKFLPGETVRWEVEHRSNVRTTVSKQSQSAETVSLSVKVWRTKEVKPDGTVTFVHSVDRVDMRQKLTGRNEVRYNSATDAKPPVGYEGAARSVGVPLSIVTINAQGKVLHRKRCKEQPQTAGGVGSSTADPTTAGDPTANANPTASHSESWMTIPLPERPVAVGETWSLPQEIDVPLQTGGVKKVKTIQNFVLESVKTGVATILVSTEILTPITDPAVEAQLVQRESAGRVRFDIDAGRIIAQQMDTDKHVVGFRGEASSVHYVNRFSERLISEKTEIAGKTRIRD
jgi:hypothetical protein